jgi:hypothetical protein
LTEEVMGFEGFSDSESILNHVPTPCRVNELGSFAAIESEEWVPAAHAHRHCTEEEEGVWRTVCRTLVRA